MKPPHTLTDSALVDYADDHLQYEFDMLAFSTGILVSLASNNKDGFLSMTIKNGLLNSYSLHARNLINFLFSHSQGHDRPTDIIIEDYLEKGDLVRSYISISPLLDEALIKSNKQVAHLTMERIQYEQAGKEWKFIELNKQIYKALNMIIPHVPENRLSKDLRQKFCQNSFHFPIVDIDAVNSRRIDRVSFSLRKSKPEHYF